jgi:tungstate transport system substrate-binding protein
MKLFSRFFLFLLLGAMLVAPRIAVAQQTSITVAVTTSFENSGLAEVLLPRLLEDTGLEVRLVVVGTGQALKLGENGDVDAVLVHAKQAELAFIEAGFGIERIEIMYNDFVIVGPSEDPAGIRNMSSVAEVLARIAATESIFASRGDDSGTHKKEILLWALAGIDAENLESPWYRSTGSGMGATLNMAAATDSYVLTDRGTWISFGNKQNLQLLFDGDPPLDNQYSILLINPERHPYINSEGARIFADWMAGERGQQVIGEYRLEGEQLFHPNASMAGGPS